MSKLKRKDIIYTGLGFPIKLRNVELIEFEGDWHPKVAVQKVADFAIKALVLQPSRLTGNQIRFIRDYFAMSLRKFAQVVNESHMAVKKWESCAEKTTSMDKNIEIMLRLYIYEQVEMPSKRKSSEFYRCYVELRKLFSSLLATARQKAGPPLVLSCC